MGEIIMYGEVTAPLIRPLKNMPIVISNDHLWDDAHGTSLKMLALAQETLATFDHEALLELEPNDMREVNIKALDRLKSYCHDDNPEIKLWFCTFATMDYGEHAFPTHRDYLPLFHFFSVKFRTPHPTMPHVDIPTIIWSEMFSRITDSDKESIRRFSYFVDRWQESVGCLRGFDACDNLHDVENYPSKS